MTYAAEKLVMRLRLLAFINILRQAVGWFDLEKNSAGMLITRLSRDAPLIKGVSNKQILFTWFCKTKISGVRTEGWDDVECDCYAFISTNDCSGKWMETCPAAAGCSARANCGLVRANNDFEKKPETRRRAHGPSRKGMCI